MTRIQQVHWELTMDYIGHPYYVSGNAIMHTLGQQLPSAVHQHLHASHGVFVPGQFGRFPEDHSQNGVRPYLGSGLPEVKSYDDLFLLRDPSHRWLLESRPRDALNTHEIRVQSGHPALAPETIIDKPDDARKRQQTTRWYVNAYLHATRDDILPLDEQVLAEVQFGGKRNYGYGTARLKETQIVDLDALEYSRITDSESFLVELMTPYVLESDYPDAANQSVPWWWQADRSDLRMREEKIVDHDERYTLRTVDHGQVVKYTGDRPIETAKNGILRLDTHAKYGFGELRLKPIESAQERQKSP